ncbi:MAG TPA: phosphate ABC transporter permease PstA [Tepidisphaeraceae bacterium]|jgi:phosphate transport system permease protein|nr:phosphate ABC transporter permease PstA [Tepidisphaeraceae bacterium]
MTQLENPPSEAAPSKPAFRHRVQRRTSVAARGEPMVWLTGGCVALAVLMIVALIGFIVIQGFSTFWPGPLMQVQVKAGETTRTVLGEPSRQDVYVYSEQLPLDQPVQSVPGMTVTVTNESAEANTKTVRYEIPRTLYEVGNYDITGEDFTWAEDRNVTATDRPQWGLVIERVAWGNAYGTLEAVIDNGVRADGPEAAWRKFQELHPQMRKLASEARHIEKHAMGEISKEQNEIRLELRGVEREHGVESQQYKDRVKSFEPAQQKLEERLVTLRKQVAEIRQKMETAKIVVRAPGGQLIPADRTLPDEPMLIAQVVRAYPANQLSTAGKAGVYVGRWWEYLSDEPREANAEGGVLPAIVGTVLLTFLMIIFVVPVGVIAAIYLREYAQQGLLVSIVRISVNNLAGVPSIVFGVFGLGFFCYILGANLDQLLFSDRLPDPTVGKSAMIWAALTLALLTLPLIIVATEEALSAVPRSVREGSYACGASKWQTIRRIVMPRAMPGVMTGMILAIARGAGEVAPLMLVGAVKLAPELPISADPKEFFGASRSFMHLGFHIYDLGFQSRNSEAAKSMVYTTTLLLIGIVVVLNIVAILIRTRLRKAHAGGAF